MSESIANYNVPEDHVKTLEKNVKNMLKTKLAGKTERSLSSCVSHREYGGKGPRNRVIDYLGPVEFIERKNSSQDTVLQLDGSTRRWVFMKEAEPSISIIRPDELKKTNEKDPPCVERMCKEIVRKMDAFIMNAFFATVKTDRLDTIEFNTDNVVPKENSGLTLQKLKAVRELMIERHADLKDHCKYIAVTADDLADLRESAEPSAYKRNVELLVDGQITNFKGFTFVRYEGVSREAGNARKLPVWVSDGMHLGIWQWPKIVIYPPVDEDNRPRVHTTLVAGATRLDEDSVFQIEV